MSVHAGSIWIDENQDRLPQDLWIAANANGLVDESRELPQLLEALNVRNILLSEVTLAYIHSGVVQ